MLEVDAGVFSTIDISSVVSGNWKYDGGILAPNGVIYFVPRNADDIGVFNPTDGSFTTMEIPFSLSTDEVRYSGAVLGKNGKIYLVPCLAKTLAVFDPSTGVISAVDSVRARALARRVSMASYDT